MPSTPNEHQEGDLKPTTNAFSSAHLGFGDRTAKIIRQVRRQMPELFIDEQIVIFPKYHGNVADLWCFVSLFNHTSSFHSLAESL